MLYSSLSRGVLWWLCGLIRGLSAAPLNPRLSYRSVQGRPELAHFEL